jgi:drug/metabolite transporter (DMT)-like permease
MLQTERKTELDGLAMSTLVVCCMFWGLQQVLVKATVPELPPVFQAFLRFVGATVLLVLWARWRRVPLLVDRAMWPAGLLAGALFSGEFAMLYMGLQYTTASRLTIFLYTSPFWVSALLPLFVRSESLRRIQWIGLACAFVAVGFAMQGGANAAAPQQWLGDTLALAAGLCWGLTTVTIRATSLARATPEQLLFCQIAVSALTLPVLSLALGEQWTFEFSRFAAMSLFVQTVVGAFASYLAWMWLLGRYPATKISVFVFLTPLFALLFGALWLNEPITLALACALALVALGIVLVNAPARRV